MTRVEQGQALTEWMQAVVTSERDLLAEVLRMGLNRLSGAELRAGSGGRDRMGSLGS